MRRAFTMVELMLAVVLLGVITAVTALTFRAVSGGWQSSTEYIDKTQRTDFALTQVISGLRSMYYPHDGKQDDRYGFMLTDNGDGDDPDDSDVIEWSKTGSAIVGNKSAVADTVHRVQVMVLEEGNNDWKEEIQVTGLYARLCNDAALIPKDDNDDTDYSFANDELYQPILIADGIVGFNCRVLKTADDAEDGENDRRKFEDEFDESNAVPYKIELTFRIADPEGRGYRSNAAPMMRIVRIPIHEQSLDGASTPGEGDGGSGKTTGSKSRNTPPPGVGGGGRAPVGGGGRAPGGGGGAPGGGGAAPGPGGGPPP